MNFQKLDKTGSVMSRPTSSLSLAVLLAVVLAASAQAQTPSQEEQRNNSQKPANNSMRPADKAKISEDDVESIEQKNIEERERAMSENDPDMDMPAQRNAYFRRGHAVMGENSAELLHRAFRQKQQMLESIGAAQAAIANGQTGAI